MDRELRLIRHRIEVLILCVLALIAGTTDGTTPYAAIGLAILCLVMWRRDEKRKVEGGVVN